MVKEVEQFYWEGKPQINQIIVNTDKGYYFVSYGLVVAAKLADRVQLAYNWNYSKTTAKWTTRFLGCTSSKEVRDRIKSGEYDIVARIVIE